ncbi:MAG: DUF362 domain-containing protein [Promethearchaeota archaeon]
MKKIIDTERFVVHKRDDGRLFGEEKPSPIYTGIPDIFIQKIGPSPIEDIKQGLEKISAREVIKPGDLVAIKVNIGGGINGVLPTYTDPELVHALACCIRDLGAKPFVCEADMRGHQITPQLLEKREYTRYLNRYKIPFVNLSRVQRVSFKFLGIKRRIDLPKILLDPKVKVISFAPPKHHWECGISCTQKNMYGAIADYKKSRFHRFYEMIDHVIAAAARIMKPHLNIIGTKQLGAGLGPHFSIPFNFNRLIFARDMLSCDLFCAEMLGFPIEKIKYFQINRRGLKIEYRILLGSADIPRATLKKIQENYISPENVQRSKQVLFVQYYVPSYLQIHVYHYFEWLLTWINKRFYVPRGDPPST